MPQRHSLVKQVQNVLDFKLKTGHSKHADKKDNVYTEHIYSWSTYRSYLKHGCYFVNWAKSAHGCKDLDSAKPFIDEYLQMRNGNGLSPYTFERNIAYLPMFASRTFYCF